MFIWGIFLILQIQMNELCLDSARLLYELVDTQRSTTNIPTLSHYNKHSCNVRCWHSCYLVLWCQKKHSPTHTHPDHRTSFINFLHLLRSIASSWFSLCAWQSSQTTSLQVLFGLPLGLGPLTSYFMHFFTQSSSSFRSTCPYHHSLFCCNTSAMSSIPNLSLSLPYLAICLFA